MAPLMALPDLTELSPPSPAAESLHVSCKLQTSAFCHWNAIHMASHMSTLFLCMACECCTDERLIHVSLLSTVAGNEMLQRPPCIAIAERAGVALTEQKHKLANAKHFRQAWA